MSIKQPAVGRDSVCVAGGTAEPVVSIERIKAALRDEG